MRDLLPGVLVMEHRVPFMTDDSVFIIAEIANAHEGRPEIAMALVDAAGGAGADAVKFQLFTADELAVPTHGHYDLYRTLEMAAETWRQLVGLARRRKLRVFADVFGIGSAALAQEVGVEGYKIHVADLGNVPLLSFVARSGLPVLLSVGGSTWVEIAEALDVLRQAAPSAIVLVHGFQGYPTPLSDSNLRRIEVLRQKFGLLVGYASHVDGGSQEAVELPVWAVAAGADLIEVHLTLDRSAKGPDYFSSLDPSRFAEMTRKLRTMEEVRGLRSLGLARGELRYRAEHRKYVVATREIKAGERVDDELLSFKRVDEPPPGAPLTLEGVVGRTARLPITANSPIRRRDMRVKVAATLACRAESSRLYGKPLQRVGDRTILEHLIDRLRQVSAIEGIVLAVAETPGQGVFLNFAQRHSLPFVVGPESDVLGRLIQAGEHVGAEIVVRQTTENPFMYWENLDELIRLHIEEGADLTVTEKLPLGACAEVISLEALRRSHSFGEDRHRSEFCSMFIAENPSAFVVKRVPPPEGLRRPELRLTVDTPEDLILVRKLWKALQREGHLITISEIVAFVDAHPEITAINSGQDTLHLWK